MIRGFEEQTKPITDYELTQLLPMIVYGLRAKVGAKNVVSGKQIVSGMVRLGYKLTEPRLRKIVGYIRHNNIIPGLVSNGKGYFVATSVAEIDDCIESLQGRVAAIQANIDALTRQRQLL